MYDSMRQDAIGEMTPCGPLCGPLERTTSVGCRDRKHCSRRANLFFEVSVRSLNIALRRVAIVTTAELIMRTDSKEISNDSILKRQTADTN